MQVDVLISTFDRLDTLKATVQSLRVSSYKKLSIFIAVDGNEKILHEVAKLPVCVVYNKNRKDFVMSMNTLLQYAYGDAVLYASDDLVFEKDCIEKAVKMLKEKFPDTDGLIGIRQDIKGCSSAFGLMGRKFIDRFPHRCVFCPDFIHYSSDFEIGRFARNINKWGYCESALVRHKRLKDQTWRVAHKVRDRDFETMKLRRQKKLFWGHNFELATDLGKKRLKALGKLA